MKKSVLFVVGGVVLGIVLTGVVLYAKASSLMLLEDEARYGFEEAVTVFTAETEKAGWKIPTVHDLQATMQKFGKDVKQVKVFELCHPEHAYRILRENDERVVSALMPCRVAIYEKHDGRVYVSRMNSGLMGKMMSGVVPEVMDVAARESEAIVKAILK